MLLTYLSIDILLLNGQSQYNVEVSQSITCILIFLLYGGVHLLLVAFGHDIVIECQNEQFFVRAGQMEHILEVRYKSRTIKTV